MANYVAENARDRKLGAMSRNHFATTVASPPPVELPGGANLTRFTLWINTG